MEIDFFNTKYFKGYFSPVEKGPPFGKSIKSSEMWNSRLQHPQSCRTLESLRISILIDGILI